MAVDAARAKSVFLAASELVDPADRAAYLDRECADEADLRVRVEALLRANDAAPLPEPGGADATGPFRSDAPVTASVGASSAEPTSDCLAEDEHAGTVVGGKYTLVEVIGEGGMGAVWRAKQTEPVKRYVAVKLIKAGMDSKQVLARFEAERQALALMDHPNIAKVLDGGLHESRPFFVMELVKGVPITEYCDRRKLTPKERLELFVPVCQAIQHAHQKGVIHRDIKPSNVLIALFDDKPVVKVIDFGVAKATGGALTERTIDTGFGGVVGTPQYMSPEQATFNNLDVDTRSDVYTLGVLLYELLTGSPPFAKKDLEQKGLLEMLRVVREEEPPRPSTKLSTADALPTLSANRGTEPRALTGLLRNELDWIVMKALEKDRTRRYETANGLAADVLRYLGGEAVQAHPPSTAYRLRKFVRRNKGQVVGVAAVFLALVAGIAGTTWGMVRADSARRGEAALREVAESRWAEAETARAQEAEARRREAVLTRGELLAKLGQSHEQSRKYGEALVAFEEANTLLETTFGPDHPATLTSLKNLAMCCSRAGKHARAHPLHTEYLNRVARVHGPDDPVTLQNMRYVAWYYSNAGRHDLALQLYEHVHALLSKATPNSSEAVAIRYDLASAYARAGQPDRAIPLYEDLLARYRKGRAGDQAVLQVIQALSDAYRSAGRHGPRLALLEEEVNLHAKVYGAKDVSTLYATAKLAAAYQDAGRTADAIRLYEEVYRVGNNDHSLRWVTGKLVECYVASGAHAEAAKLALDQLAATRRTLPANSPQLAAALAQAGQTLARVGDWSGSETVLRECHAIRVKYEPDAWSTFDTQSLLGGALLGEKKYAEAEPLLLDGYEGLKLREKTIPPEAAPRIPESIDRLIELYTATDKPDEAKKWRAVRAKYPLGLAPPPREKK